MLKFIDKILIKRFYKKINKELDKISGIPKNEKDWKVRALACKNLLTEVGNDEIKLTALNLIILESETMASVEGVYKVEEYLSEFSQEKGYESFIQVSGPKFADEFRFYRNKRKITVINDKISNDYQTSSWNPGKHYNYTENNTEYTIALNPKSREIIFVTIDTEDDTETLKIELKQINPK